jgi:1-acyl-sn-glycerol-3-phosphate acyltransferase
VTRSGLIIVFLANVWFYPAFLVMSLAVSPFFVAGVVLSHVLGGRRRGVYWTRRMNHMYGVLVLLVLRPVARIILQGHGWHTPPTERCIYVCNHRSASDPFLMAKLPSGEIVQIVNRWPFRLPILGSVARLADYISIREMSPEQFFAKASCNLAEGAFLTAFPEGTRSGGRCLGAFHSAVFRLALQTGAPVVPVAISGNEQTPPRGSLLLRPACIVMSMLPPLHAETYRTMSPFQFKNHVRGLIDTELRRIEGTT